MALLQNAEYQPVANVPAGTDDSSVLIRTLSHTLYALLATLTTGRSLRLAQRVQNRNGFEIWRRLLAKTHRRHRVEDSQCCKPCCSLEVVTIRQSSRKLGMRRNIRWTSPTKLRDNLLVNSQQFESNYNKLRAIIQAYLNSNKSWTADDSRNDTKESDPMEVDHISKGKGKGAKPDKQDVECCVCGKKGHFARHCWSRANQDKTVNEVEGATVDSDARKEFVFYD